MREKQYKAFCGIALTGHEWEQILGVRVVDPDGWRGRYELDFTTRIHLNDFLQRSVSSTIEVDKSCSDFWDAVNFNSKEQDVK